MKLEEHQKALEEHLRHLNKAIDEGIEENQRNIGYNVSQGSVELFAVYLHKLNLIGGSGDQFDHRIFKSKQLIQIKVPLQFPKREEILKLMEEIERARNSICYGKRKPLGEVERMILAFRKLQENMG